MLLIYNDIGRIGQMVESSDPAYPARLAKDGVRFIQRGTGMHDTYVDMSGPVAFERMRPQLAAGFDKTVLAPLEVATFPSVPACQVAISGPTGSNSVEHKGGPLQIRFLLPGTYVVAFEPFPYQRVEAEFRVEVKVSVSVKVTA